MKSLAHSVRALPSIPGVWLGRSHAPAATASTGFAQLDALLPGKGWPIAALTELVPLAEGIGELRLLMPVLTRLANEDRRIVLVRPPYLPYAPAIVRAGLPLASIVWIAPNSDDDARWACEQTLRQRSVGAVLLWTSVEKDIALRRLQVAAADSEAILFAYRPYASLRNASPAAVRLALHPAAGAMNVEVIKAKGGRAGTTALCSLRSAA